MGFGGSTAAANVTLKYNRDMLNKQAINRAMQKSMYRFSTPKKNTLVYEKAYDTEAKKKVLQLINNQKRQDQLQTLFALGIAILLFILVVWMFIS